MSEKVWVVYEPRDYQKAYILGVYRNRADAVTVYRDARSEALGEGNVNWSYIGITEMVLE